ncbi:uncharacterized protein LOC128482999 isoform X2 [Spea bombifrons]|uniref:uncharacterized protein LOC128482999 isoform X2 n=1 Tax=Spea bombifrons TaxID=233779 RepID=UPI002349D69C|nr:uncharacterized protein LOC128482999 isoform X2 [Spea bombifrons]
MKNVLPKNSCLDISNITTWPALSGSSTGVPVPRIDENKSAPDDMHKILAFLHQLQGRQDITDSTVESLKRENEALWKEVIHLRQKQYQSQPRFEPVSPSQSYDRMANAESNQTLMIDSTGNYNEFAVPKGSKSIDQDYDNRSQWTVNGKETRGTKRAFSPKGEQLESSTEEASETFTSITLPQMFETYQPDDYDNPTDSSSSDSEDLTNEDTFHDPSHSSMNISGQTQGTNKRFKISLEEHDFETDYKMEYSGSEDADEHKNHYGHAKKRRKSCASAKMERMLKHMHRENVCLTKRVLALEQQSFKKLSEISTVLSTLAGYVMNTQNFPKPFLSSLTADEKRVQPKES